MQRRVANDLDYDIDLFIAYLQAEKNKKHTNFKVIIGKNELIILPYKKADINKQSLLNEKKELQKRIAKININLKTSK